MINKTLYKEFLIEIEEKDTIRCFHVFREVFHGGSVLSEDKLLEDIKKDLDEYDKQKSLSESVV